MKKSYVYLEITKKKQKKKEAGVKQKEENMNVKEKDVKKKE